MKTEQILKALSGLIPEDAREQVAEAVSSLFDSAVAELEEEYNKKLEEAFKEHEAELQESERVREEGYGQAWDIIVELRERIDTLREESQETLEQGFEEAYQMLKEEQAKADALEASMYEQYNKKFQDSQEFMIDKIDEFLRLQGEEYYEMAKRDVMNDPAIVEHKLAFEKILEVTSNYLSDEDYNFATSSKVEQLQKQLDETRGQMKILEGKNMRLSMEKERLNEQVRQTQELISEQTVKQERKARLEKAKKVEGRGQTEQDRLVVIGEHKENSGETVAEHEDTADNFAEKVGEKVFSDWKYLSGIKPTNKKSK